MAGAAARAVLLCLAALLHSSTLGSAAEVELELQDGKLRGAATKNGWRFLGVPFAEPPVGRLRWQPPAQVRPWPGVRPAAAYGASCVQSKNAFVDLSKMSEDCLYLDVYLPGAPLGKLPVMVFFYGGSDAQGSAMFPLYAGGNLVARTGEIAVITVNYRLNAFGWLGSEALRGDDGSTGNWGLQDQREALRWVRRNAAGLGVDADRLTIFGESAGAANTAAHLAAERSVGLFSRAAMESGNFAPWSSHNLEHAALQFNKLAANAKCNDATRRGGGGGGGSLADCLRAKNTTEIVAASSGLPSGGLVDWAAVVDGVEFKAALTDPSDKGAGFKLASHVP
eukprot:SAG22_NODE_1264_length_4966_cov_1.918430_6_plen_338_part_00